MKKLGKDLMIGDICQLGEKTIGIVSHNNEFSGVDFILYTKSSVSGCDLYGEKEYEMANVFAH